MKNLANKTTQTSKTPLFIGLDMAAGRDITVTNSVTSTPLKNERAICEMVSAISALAILSREVLHIEIKYTAQINEIEVKVFDADTDYSLGHRRTFGCNVYLDDPQALNILKALEDKLIELVADAKDKAMGGC